jgi:hypothetical protein
VPCSFFQTDFRQLTALCVVYCCGVLSAHDTTRCDFRTQLLLRKVTLWLFLAIMPRQLSWHPECGQTTLRWFVATQHDMWLNHSMIRPHETFCCHTLSVDQARPSAGVLETMVGVLGKEQDKHLRIFLWLCLFYARNDTTMKTRLQFWQHLDRQLIQVANIWAVNPCFLSPRSTTRKVRAEIVGVLMADAGMHVAACTVCAGHRSPPPCCSNTQLACIVSNYLLVVSVSTCW